MTRYLALGAHPDDIEMGCGATLFSLLTKNDELRCITMSKVDKVPGNENIVNEWKGALKYLKNNSPCYRLQGFLHDFPNRSLRDHHLSIRKVLDAELNVYKPEVIFTTGPDDVHKDHKYLGEEAVSTFRNKKILTYISMRQSPFTLPNYYKVLQWCDIDRALKMISHYECQRRKLEFDPELILATFRHRGGETRERFAQAFKHIRTVIK